MKVACVIPARMNSSRFPGKLLQAVLGKSVLRRTFENARKVSHLDPLCVATDDEEIAEHVRSFGGRVVITSSLPRDGTQRAIEAMRACPSLSEASSLMVLQGDNPAVSPETIERISRALQEDPEAVLSTGASPIQTREEYLSPHIVKCVLDQRGRALYFSRSPIPYFPPDSAISSLVHVGIYCYRRQFLETLSSIQETPLQKHEDLEQLKVLEAGYRIAVALVQEKAPSVDTPSDLVKLEEYLCKTPQNIFS